MPNLTDTGLSEMYEYILDVWGTAAAEQWLAGLK